MRCRWFWCMIAFRYYIYLFEVYQAPWQVECARLQRYFLEVSSRVSQIANHKLIRQFVIQMKLYNNWSVENILIYYTFNRYIVEIDPTAHRLQSNLTKSFSIRVKRSKTRGATAILKRVAVVVAKYPGNPIAVIRPNNTLLSPKSPRKGVHVASYVRATLESRAGSHANRLQMRGEKRIPLPLENSKQPGGFFIRDPWQYDWLLRFFFVGETSRLQNSWKKSMIKCKDIGISSGSSFENQMEVNPNRTISKSAPDAFKITLVDHPG